MEVSKQKPLVCDLAPPAFAGLLEKDYARLISHNSIQLFNNFYADFKRRYDAKEFENSGNNPIVASRINAWGKAAKSIYNLFCTRLSSRSQDKISKTNPKDPLIELAFNPITSSLRSKPKQIQPAPQPRRPSPPVPRLPQPKPQQSPIPPQTQHVKPAEKIIPSIEEIPSKILHPLFRVPHSQNPSKSHSAADTTR